MRLLTETDSYDPNHLLLSTVTYCYDRSIIIINGIYLYRVALSVLKHCSS